MHNAMPRTTRNIKVWPVLLSSNLAQSSALHGGGCAYPCCTNPTAPDSTARSWPCIQEFPGRGCEGDKYARRCFADMQRRGQCPSWPPHQTPQARPTQTRRPQEVGSRGPTAHSCRSRGRVGIYKWLTWQEAIDGLPRDDGAPLIQPGCRAVPLCRPVGACCLRPASVCSSLAGRL